MINLTTVSLQLSASIMDHKPTTPLHSQV